MPRRTAFSLFFSSFLICLTFTPPAAQAQELACNMFGVSAAVEVNEPEGQYLYVLDILWDTDAQWAQSHIDVGLGIDLETCPCLCDEFSFFAPDTAGSSNGMLGVGECTVYYLAEYNCSGDPSVEGMDDPLIKFEPYPSDCEPAPRGEGTFTFYSNWPPVPVDNPNELLTMKFDSGYCRGELTGFLPACLCGSTPTETSTWGQVKSLYR